MTLDTADRIIGDGAIAISRKRIAEFGSRRNILAPWKAQETIDCRDRSVIPGLINIHNHTRRMITQTMIEDLAFVPRFTPCTPQGYQLAAEDAGVLARLSTYELLRSECTTIVDFYRYPSALAQAHATPGSRAIIAGRIHDADPEPLSQRRYEHRVDIGEKALARMSF